VPTRAPTTTPTTRSATRPLPSSARKNAGAQETSFRPTASTPWRADHRARSKAVTPPSESTAMQARSAVHESEVTWAPLGKTRLARLDQVPFRPVSGEVVGHWLIVLPRPGLVVPLTFQRSHGTRPRVSPPYACPPRAGAAQCPVDAPASAYDELVAKTRSSTATKHSSQSDPETATAANGYTSSRSVVEPTDRGLPARHHCRAFVQAPR
jgi:hypothetical protein